MLPRLYPIVDAANFIDAQQLYGFTRELISGGATLLQYRNKKGSAREVLSHARQLRVVAGDTVRLIMNDRADLCVAARFDGVHLGQEDLSPQAADRVVSDQGLIGISTHNLRQAMEADASSADYIAIGPIFATQSKERRDPVVGLDGLEQIRRATRKTLVAIGGITLANCQSVIDAGADSVAVISGLLASPAKTVEDFIRVLM